MPLEDLPKRGEPYAPIPAAIQIANQPSLALAPAIICILRKNKHISCHVGVISSPPRSLGIVSVIKVPTVAKLLIVWKMALQKTVLIQVANLMPTSLSNKCCSSQASRYIVIESYELLLLLFRPPACACGTDECPAYNLPTSTDEPQEGCSHLWEPHRCFCRLRITIVG